MDAMRRAVASVAELVGNTPLVRMRTGTENLAPGVQILAKLEYLNPGRSVKDRAALNMVRHALESGALHEGVTLIDSTSGNTGVAYSWLGAALGFKVALVMPENVTEGRKHIARAMGVEVIYSSPLEGSDGAIRLVRQVVAENPGKYFYPDQYSNPHNPGAHETGTAAEIWRDTGGRVTHFVAGIGTGGTIMGTGRGLKRFNPAIKVFAAEPEDAFHGLEGLKHMASSIVPAIYHAEELDGVIPVGTEAGWDLAEQIAKREGILAGHSSGAALGAALRVAETLREGVVVTLFPDSAERYFDLRSVLRMVAI